MTTASPQRTLYQWFAASAATHPSRTALEVGGRTLTYAELAALSDTFAARLLHLLDGRRPHRVGLLASRTTEAYAGYLAVLRLGAAVVPLGPSFPQRRNAGIARSAAVDAILADGSGGAGQQLPAPTLHIAATYSRSETLPEGHLSDVGSSPAGPEDLAYILFTSGSTGSPKGVPILHRNVNAFLAHVVPRYAAGPGARISQAFDLTFDPSVLDMFAAWGTGATLVVPAQTELLSPVRFINRHRITHWNSVPSIASLASRLRSLKPGSMPDLRRSTFCGEPLTLQQAHAWQKAAPHSTVENAYGPTELTITCSAYQLPRDPSRWPRPANDTVPIGVPYPGADIGVIGGELCVRGPQRFPGYLDPADNAGRFLAPDGSPYKPTTPLTDQHWYRTGDRVTPLAEAMTGPPADLVHLGRIDQQVQVHGYRVELSEVEAAIRDLPGVVDAVVLPYTTPDSSTELAAAYTGGTAEETLQSSLRDRLPAYMVPATLTAMEVLPLNANGKIDRRTLAQTLTGLP